ncbi:MAG TPA: archease [Firmicutes bacterium]|nr:archease [Candidatus Fermentithermobacillaceae bacterium]
MGEEPKTQSYEFRDHVADVRIRAWGTGFKETLVAVTTAVWRYVLGDVALPRSRTWGVSTEGQDMDDILVSFLNEQIYLYDSEGLVPLSVKELKVTEEEGAFRLEAVFEGCLVAEMPGPPERQVKAATYNDLVVRPDLIEVTLDV